MRVFQIKIKFESINKRKYLIAGKMSDEEFFDPHLDVKTYNVLADNDIIARNAGIDFLKRDYDKNVVLTTNEVGLRIIYCETSFLCEITE